MKKHSRTGLPSRLSFLCLALVALVSLCKPVLGESPSSPKQLKQDAIVTLQGISTGDRDLQKKISSALDDISRSLSDKNTNFFLDDWRILPPPAGVNVFDREKNAADDLAGLLKDRNTSADIRSIVQRVLDALLQADREIAERSLVTAERFVKAGEGEARVAAGARQQFDRAAKETDPKKAIEGFKNAWQSSQEVANQNGLVITSFSDGPSLFSSRITSNRLTATFQSFKNQNGDDNGNNKNKDDKNNNGSSNDLNKQDSRQSIEFIEIIQEAPTSATIRKITTVQDVPVFPKGGDDSSKLRPWSVTLTSSWDGKDNSGQIAKDGAYNYVAFGRIVDADDEKNGKDEKKDDNNDNRIVAVAFPISGSVMLDSTPPDITAVRDKPPNAAGWNNTDVTVSFLCSDATGVSACPAPITVTTEGGNQRVSGTAVDVAGNTAAVAVILNIDKTPPLIAVVQAPLPNARGWNNSDVTESFAASDALSGLANVTRPVIVRTEGANQRIVGTAVDVAGNVATAIAMINLDKTAPALTFGAAAPEPNAAGWNNSDVRFSFTTADNLSGVAATSVPSPLTLSAEGASVTGTVTLTDVAGNTAMFTSPAAKIDKTPPIVTTGRSPDANANGWNNTNVTVIFTGADTLSGIASCSPTTTLSTEGANQSVSGTCTDIASNISQPATVSGIKIDKTAPTLTFGAATPVANIVGWNNTDVSIEFAPNDTLSGVASTNVPRPLVLSAEGAAVSGTVIVTDNAGNAAAFNSPVFKIDKTPPVLAITAPADGSVWPTAALSLTGTAADGLSGIASLKCNGVPTTPQSSFLCNLILSDGSNAIRVDATDFAGNSAVANETISYILPITNPLLLGSLQALPPFGVPNMPVLLTVFVGIPNPGVIPGSVDLLRVLPAGPAALLGQLHDDGKNGDGLAGDTIYTIQLPINEPAAGQVQLQVSADFVGHPQTIVSPVLTIPITSDTNLPPDPGLPGTVTLTGIDSDGDGIRDDVQRYIALTYPDSARTRAVQTDMARTIQSLLLDSTDTQKSIAHMVAVNNAIQCSVAIHGLANTSHFIAALRAQLLNTLARVQAYLAANAQAGGHTFISTVNSGQQKALCSFNPDLLPN